MTGFSSFVRNISSTDDSISLSVLKILPASARLIAPHWGVCVIHHPVDKNSYDRLKPPAATLWHAELESAADGHTSEPGQAGRGGTGARAGALEVARRRKEAPARRSRAHALGRDAAPHHERPRAVEVLDRAGAGGDRARAGQLRRGDRAHAHEPRCSGTARAPRRPGATGASWSTTTPCTSPWCASGPA